MKSDLNPNHGRIRKYAIATGCARKDPSRIGGIRRKSEFYFILGPVCGGSVDSGGFSVRMLYHIPHKNEASLLYALGSVDLGCSFVSMLYHIPHKNEVSLLYALAPFNQEVFMRKRHEFDSSKLGGHLPHHTLKCPQKKPTALDRP
ncbi:hypothetical protein AVEN_105916-1 [Araneus ventricosus]|uniref:Uncharacterized protein n=1 Tax=Araneus ventricosus TaxID=182803 RepID=A0A4Y2TL02_ARAVE|nr:hypothetical protein AVEN_105916-1 [Araneus ventricosus]